MDGFYITLLSCCLKEFTFSCVFDTAHRFRGAVVSEPNRFLNITQSLRILRTSYVYIFRCEWPQNIKSKDFFSPSSRWSEYDCIFWQSSFRGCWKTVLTSFSWLGLTLNLAAFTKIPWYSRFPRCIFQPPPYQPHPQETLRNLPAHLSGTSGHKLWKCCCSASQIITPPQYFRL